MTAPFAHEIYADEHESQYLMLAQAITLECLHDEALAYRAKSGRTISRRATLNALFERLGCIPHIVTRKI